MKKPYSIFIVEDEFITATDLREKLKSLGYVIAGEAKDGEEAIRKVMDTNPDLILMDIKLNGEMDGFEAAEKIHNHVDIPIIYLTAFSDQHTLDRAKYTQPFAYLLKPFDNREIHTSIEVAMHRHEIEKRVRGRERWLSRILDSIRDAVIAADSKGCIQYMNSVAEAQTAWRQEEAMGKNVGELFQFVNTASGDKCDLSIIKVVQTGEVVTLPNCILHIPRGQKELSVDGSLYPIEDEEGIIGVVFVFRESTGGE